VSYHLPLPFTENMWPVETFFHENNPKFQSQSLTW